MLYTFRYTFVADHYQHVASIGIIAFVAADIDRSLSKRQSLIPIVSTVLLLVLGALT